jgi:hypothetical protein
MEWVPPYLLFGGMILAFSTTGRGRLLEIAVVVIVGTIANQLVLRWRQSRQGTRSRR